MIFFIISIILLLISIFLFIKTKNKINNNNELEKEEEEIQTRINKKIIEEKNLQDKVGYIRDRLNDMQNIINNQINDQKVTFRKSLSNFVNLLDYQYQQEEK